MNIKELHFLAQKHNCVIWTATQQTPFVATKSLVRVDKEFVCNINYTFPSLISDELEFKPLQIIKS